VEVEGLKRHTDQTKNWGLLVWKAEARYAVGWEIHSAWGRGKKEKKRQEGEWRKGRGKGDAGGTYCPWGRGVDSFSNNTIVGKNIKKTILEWGNNSKTRKDL